MKRVFLLLLSGFFFFSGIFSVWALDAGYEKVLKEADALYQKSQYDAALSKYQKLSLMEATPEVFYNLGNVYFKTKKLGRAIAAYEKAKMLAPRDSDIRKNLKFSMSLIQSKITDQRSWFDTELNNLFSYVSFTEGQIAALALTAVTLFWMILLLIFGRNPFRGWVLKTLLIFVLTAVLACGLKYYFLWGQTYGVLVRQDAEVRYGPSKDEKVVFRLPEGLKVRLLEDREGWERVQLTSKDTGWIPKDDVEIIKIA